MTNTEGGRVVTLPILLRVEDVAEILRTTPKAIYTMVERRSLPGVVRVGRRLLFRHDEIARWIERGTEQPIDARHPEGSEPTKHAA